MFFIILIELNQRDDELAHRQAGWIAILVMVMIISLFVSLSLSNDDNDANANDDTANDADEDLLQEGV